jgi:hypothetical protein
MKDFNDWFNSYGKDHSSIGMNFIEYWEYRVNSAIEQGIDYDIPPLLMIHMLTEVTAQTIMANDDWGNAIELFKAIQNGVLEGCDNVMQHKIQNDAEQIAEERIKKLFKKFNL